MANLNDIQNPPRPSKRAARSSLWGAAREAFWIALDALRAHKLRSFLTLLGVVIATFTLILVMSVINGMNLYIADHVANLGVNTFILTQFEWAQGREAWLKARRHNRPILMEEYEYLKDTMQGEKAIGASAGLGGATVRYQTHTLDEVPVSGVTPSMVHIGDQQVDLGRYFTDSDNSHATMTCFVGQDIVNAFFPSLDPIGREILVNGRPFRVIGVAKKIGSVLGQSQDNFVQIPLATFQDVYEARPALNVSVQAWNDAQMPMLEDEVRVLLRARRHIPYKEDDTFGINASATLMSAWAQLTSVIFGGTVGFVAVFMLVGGIVIMNIMLASVTERTHEIGIRKSLGARRLDILTQFAIEAIVMALAGGGIGVLLAVLASALVNLVFTSSVPLNAIVVGVTIPAMVGLFFGFYPAWKASRLDPIEALRTGE